MRQPQAMNTAGPRSLRKNLEIHFFCDVSQEGTQDPTRYLSHILGPWDKHFFKNLFLFMNMCVPHVRGACGGQNWSIGHPDDGFTGNGCWKLNLSNLNH